MTNHLLTRPSYRESFSYRESLFASKSLPNHLIRGAIGVSAIVSAVLLAQSSTTVFGVLGSLGLGLAALVAFRGCPMCWTIGLFETARNFRRK